MLKFFVVMVLAGLSALAQAPRIDPVRSPEVHPDGRVTFRVRATNATEVFLIGDWSDTKLPMQRDEQWVWSVTTGPLEPGLSIYAVSIDGVITPDPVNPRIKLRAHTSASLVDVPGNPPALWEPRDVPHGKVEVNWERSDVCGDTRAYYVYTPPGYKSGGWTRYPVLYLLHGNNDTAAGWTDVGKANFILDNLIAEGRAKPMVVVMPFGHAIPYGGAQSNNTATMERYLLTEVIPQVERKYRVARGREKRAIVGLSMGGGHALHIGLRHLELFSRVGAFSSSAPLDFENRFASLLENPVETNRKIDLLWIGCGRQDAAFARAQKFSELLTSHEIEHTFRATEGRHNFAVWRRYLAEVAPLLFR